MTVGVLLVTHDGVGEALLACTRRIFGRDFRHVGSVPVAYHADQGAVLAALRTERGRLDDGAGVLVLSDLLGATPANLAARVATRGNSRMIAGVNLPMLVRVLNYPDLDLDTLAERALEAGRDGVRQAGS